MDEAWLQLLGTGTAFHTDGRGSQAVLVRARAAPALLVDAGPTCAAALQRARVDLDCLDGLFVTHLHGDHTAGWPFVRLGLALEVGRRRPFDIHGAKGVRDCLEGLATLCYGDLFAPERPSFEIRYHEHAVCEALRQDVLGIVCDRFPMAHHPSSLAYRFEIAGRTVAVSGDTAWCDNLERLAAGCDVLVLECTSVRPNPHAHVSLAELRARIDRLAARRVVLVHLTDDVAAALGADPIPRVVAGYDGMIVPL